MNQVLAQELAPRGVVVIAGKEYSLAYPMHAVILYKQETQRIDRARGMDAAAGDNLFIIGNWEKADPSADPERFTALLWAGLHQFSGKEWTSPLTVAELERQLDFSNVAETHEKIVRTMLSYFPKAKEEPVPNEPKPETTAPAAVEEIKETDPAPAIAS